uniref:Uncharacterized protein n=1 Tax=Acrobeloides nanus TaxID=290746 RepID=A0A914CK13_9BILA
MAQINEKALVNAFTKQNPLDVMLSAPEAIVILEGLVIVVSCAPDPKLPDVKYKFIKQKSLKASIYQLISELTEALRQADNNMYSIFLKFMNLQSDFQCGFEVMANINDPDAPEALDEIVKNIKQVCNACSDIAAKTEKIVEQVLSLNQELNIACQATKGSEEDRLREAKKSLNELEEKIAANASIHERTKTSHEQARKNAEYARSEVDRTADEGTGLWISMKNAFTFGGARRAWEKKGDLKQELHTKAVKDKEEVGKKLDEVEMETKKMTAMIKNVDLDKMEMEDVIKFVGDSFASLDRVRTKWAEVVSFFNKLNSTIETLLKENSEKTDKLGSKNKFLFNKSKQLFIQTFGHSIGALETAKTYNLLSKNHIVPLLDDVSKGFSIDKATAKKRQSEIEDKLTGVQKETRKLLNERTSTTDDEIAACDQLVQLMLKSSENAPGQIES